MINFFLVFNLLLFSTLALPCSVRVPEHLVIFGQSDDIHKAFTHEGCGEEALLELSHTLKSVEGRITATQLNNILAAKNLTLNIEPQLMKVQQFNQMVRDQLMFPPGVQLRSTEAMNAPNFLNLASGDRVQIQCAACLYGTGQVLNVRILGFDGNEKSLHVRADFKKMVRAYRHLTYKPAFSDVTMDSLKEEYVETIPHTDLLTNIDTLKFYKLNKPVKAGELLRQSDLNAINLVRAGLKTQVIIENALVRLKTDGISRSNGTLGETVEVFHPEKNKKYQGKVIDINKVLVEL